MYAIKNDLFRICSKAIPSLRFFTYKISSLLPTNMSLQAQMPLKDEH